MDEVCFPILENLTALMGWKGGWPMSAAHRIRKIRNVYVPETEGCPMSRAFRDMGLFPSRCPHFQFKLSPLIHPHLTALTVGIAAITPPSHISGDATRLRFTGLRCMYCNFSIRLRSVHTLKS